MPAHNISLSDSAAERIAAIMDNEDKARWLRVSVEGGGCSGFSYKFDLVDNIAEDDIIIEKANSSVAIDPVSLEFMTGSEIDFVDDLIGQSFQIHNPNAVASCGCGTSFSI